MTCVWLTSSIMLFTAAAAGVEPYPDNSGWTESMLVLQQHLGTFLTEHKTALETLELGDWYTTGAIRTEAFSDSLWPEMAVELNAKDPNGANLWRRQETWADGIVHSLGSQSPASTYLFRNITVERPLSIVASLGSNDGIVVWLNDQKVLSNDVGRRAAPDQQQVALDLSTGGNRLLMKIFNRAGGSGFYFSLIEDPVVMLSRQIERDFPLEGRWMNADIPQSRWVDILSGPQPWGKMLETAFDDIGQAAEALRRQLQVRSPAAEYDDQRRLLELYVEACRFREFLAELKPVDVKALRSAIEDIAESFGPDYTNSAEYLEKLSTYESRLFDVYRAIAEGKANGPERKAELLSRLRRLNREALTANPLVSGQPILYIVRHQYKGDHHNTATMFQTGEVNTESFQGPAAMKTIDFGKNRVKKTLIEVPNGVVRDPEVHFSGGRIIFSMRNNIEDDYHVYEMNSDGSGLRQLTFGSGLSDIDPLYLPDDNIIFTSTRQPKYCMCNQHIMGNLFKMEPDGANIHQLDRNTLHSGHGSLMPDGRILYYRWEYVDRNFGDAQGLWTVNPDGTNHLVYYGNNTLSPGGVFDARIIGETQRTLCIFGSCHDRPWGALAVIDRRLGVDGPAAVVRIWPGEAVDLMGGFEGAKPVPLYYEGKYGFDNFRRVYPRYEDPYPLSGKYFLCSRMIDAAEHIGVYLQDVFGNEVLLHAEEPGCFDPMPLCSKPRPPVIPSRRDYHNDVGYLYVVDVYNGTHMHGVKRGQVKYLRVVESPEKRFFTHPEWGGQGIQRPGMNWHNFVNKRILGTVPVEQDGSAYFEVPSDRFIFFQLLDENKMMIQSMRSGTVVQSGERTGCTGCHENRRSATPPIKRETPLALQRPPNKLNGWYGPPRNFSYMAEVQPVFDKYCATCHDYGKKGAKELILAGDRDNTFNASYIELWRKKYINPIGAGPAQIQAPFSWGSHSSQIVRRIRKYHKTVVADSESFERIVTWIDINAPYYPFYASAYPDNLAGRSPLNGEQIRRLGELTGINFRKLENYTRKIGPQISFDRPELSPCLEKFQDKNDPNYKEALAIIEAGRESLRNTPRADMDGFVPCAVDRMRQSKYTKYENAELRSRNAIREGRKAYDYRLD